MAVKTISEALVYLKFERKLKFEVIMFSFLKKDVNYNKFLFLVFNEINWVETSMVLHICAKYNQMA